MNEKVTKESVHKAEEPISDPALDQAVLQLASSTDHKVAFVHTNVGEFQFELFQKEAPKTVENFNYLTRRGYYDNVIFHRIIDGFMIQTGDPTGTDDIAYL